jgi:hypothetical protein
MESSRYLDCHATGVGEEPSNCDSWPRKSPPRTTISSKHASLANAHHNMEPSCERDAGRKRSNWESWPRPSPLPSDHKKVKPSPSTPRTLEHSVSFFSEVIKTTITCDAVVEQFIDEI